MRTGKGQERAYLRKKRKHARKVENQKREKFLLMGRASINAHKKIKYRSLFIVFSHSSTQVSVPVIVLKRLS
jgi:hypothetical protein